MDVRKTLVELLGAVSCQGPGESLGSCPNRRYGQCGEVENLSYCVMQNTANHLIAHGVTVQEWISVDERLPENDVMVIGYTPCDGFMFVGYYHEEPKYDWKQWRIVTAMRSTKAMKKKVTHWQPLPQPPKGD